MYDKRKLWDIYTKILSGMKIDVNYSDQATTARFHPGEDGKDGSVIIPTFKFLDDETTQMLVSHEIGHALFSKYSKKEISEYFKKYGDIFNIVEDAYIEREVISEYKGLSHIFEYGYKTLLNNGFFGELNYDIINSLPLHSRLNIYVKIGTHFPDIAFNKEECEFALRIKNLRSNKDVIELCDDILNYMKETPMIPSDMGTQSSDNRNDSQSENGDEKKSYNDGNMSENNILTGVDLSDSISKILNEKLEEYGRSKKNLSKKKESVVILNGKNSTIKHLVDITKYHKTIETSFWKQHPDDGDEMVQVVRKLAKSADMVFQQKKSAKEIRNAKIRKVGKIDVKRISRYCTSSNIFKQVKTEYEGQNHGIVILIDCSNSMSDCLNNVFFQAAVLGEFCVRNNIPFEIISFGLSVSCRKWKMTDKGITHYEDEFKPCAKIADSLHFSIPSILGLENGDMVFPTFKICRWSTPVVEGLMVASQIIEKFKMHDIEKTSLYIITDGMHDVYSYYENMSIEYVSKVVYNNVLYDINDIIKSNIVHRDWIVELLCYRIKKLYGTYISIQFLLPFTLLKNSLSDRVKSKLGIKSDVMSETYSDEYFFMGKHMYYYPMPKFDWNNKSSIVSCNFFENPFIDQFQTIDISDYTSKLRSSSSGINTVFKNMLAMILNKYKFYRIMVNNYIGEIS